MFLWYYNEISIQSPKIGVNMKIKNKKKIEFICPICGIKEKIPTDIVKMLDASDGDNVDRTIPPMFDCNNCFGKMVPILYIGVKGQVYTYNDYIKQQNN